MGNAGFRMICLYSAGCVCLVASVVIFSCRHFGSAKSLCQCKHGNAYKDMFTISTENKKLKPACTAIIMQSNQIVQFMQVIVGRMLV